MSELEHMGRRVGDLEKDLHTLNHRVAKLEEEHLPYRVTTLETVVAQIKIDVAQVERISEEIRRSIDCGLAQIREQTNEQKVVQRAFVLAVGAVVTLVQLLPMIKEFLK